MLKQLPCLWQYILPKYWLTRLIGYLANSRVRWIKNSFIRFICGAYPIDMSEAAIANPYNFPTFNAFFTRALKPGIRPINEAADAIVSPADGSIAQIGTIHHEQLLQAKDMYFDLSTLLGGQTALAAEFQNGTFATIYLAPHNYHRVHMPLAGTLRQSIYIPGSLFSVNRMTSRLIPNLYARNERLVLIFDTNAGPMAVILVGALIVGSIQTVWMREPIRSNRIEISTPEQPIRLEKGAEVGHFQMGSTVILLMPAGKCEWSPQAAPDAPTLVGAKIGTLAI